MRSLIMGTFYSLVCTCIKKHSNKQPITSIDNFICAFWLKSVELHPPVIYKTFVVEIFWQKTHCVLLHWSGKEQDQKKYMAYCTVKCINIVKD